MIETIFGLDSLGSSRGFFLAFLVGLAFGFALERAGFGSSRRLAGIFYFRDMAVLKVMFTAVLTAMMGLLYAFSLGLVSPEQVYFLPTVYGAQIAGGLLFGVGFVMAGWCPGTAAVGMASGKLDALFFLIGGVIGSILFNELFSVIRPLYEWGNRGVLFVYETLSMGRASFAFLFTVVAVCCFWAAEYAEKRVTGRSDYLNTPFLKAFSLALVILAGGLFIAPDKPTVAGTVERPPVTFEASLLQSIEEAMDHVEPDELAERMVSGEAGLLVIDVRPANEFHEFHLRGAVNVPVSELISFLEPRKNSGTVVLYSNGMTHPAQARDSLARLGHTNVFILTDGLVGFIERCLKPVSLRHEPVPAGMAEKIRAWRAHFYEPDVSTGADSRSVQPPEGRMPGLVRTDWLEANLGARDLVVIDVRGQSDYNGGHIPGSLALNPESPRGNIQGLPSMLLPAAVLAAQASLMGIEAADTVVLVHAGDKLRDATLVGMAMERLGHASYAILDGGFDKWIAEKRPVETVLPSVGRTAYPVGTVPDSFTVDARTVLSELHTGTIILDVRPADYFSGAKQDEARGGHIPGAVNRDFSLDLAPAGRGRSLKPLQELDAAYAALIPRKGHPVIVHCRTGHQASQTYFVLKHLLGYSDVRWYDAGWTQWAADPELPVEK